MRKHKHAWPGRTYREDNGASNDHFALFLSKAQRAEAVLTRVGYSTDWMHYVEIVKCPPLRVPTGAHTVPRASLTAP